MLLLRNKNFDNFIQDIKNFSELPLSITLSDNGGRGEGGPLIKHQDIYTNTYTPIFLTESFKFILIKK